ncbi:DUF3861 domain-containing protein [Kistimonas asteriae]|uniref:DUF3861 domain-containing protein n=1 Tax=Kistimonas asteriae TaxID=517724 RepID=UPI001BADD712|nr:DUF3861 domain-containing protein [Kistimonas asteriae]
MKKGHHYKISIDHVMNPDGSTPEDQKVEFEFSSHDEILSIIEKLKNRSDIEPETAAPLGLGIKLFGGILLQNRTSTLFSELLPHFSAFMKQFKKSGQNPT